VLDGDPHVLRDVAKTTNFVTTILYIILPSVCLCALTLYPATDCTAATDISGVSGHWQLSR